MRIGNIQNNVGFNGLKILNTKENKALLYSAVYEEGADNVNAFLKNYDESFGQKSNYVLNTKKGETEDGFYVMRLKDGTGRLVLEQTIPFDLEDANLDDVKGATRLKAFLDRCVNKSNKRLAQYNNREIESDVTSIINRYV